MENNPNNNPADHQADIPDSQKLVQQHLQDEQHEITDEDIRNVRISTDHLDADLSDLPERKDDGDNKSGTDLDNRFITPWDVTT